MDGTYSSVEEVLAHFGVKGMRWGVRKSSPGGAETKEPKGELVLEHTFKSGDKLSIRKDPPSLLMRGLMRLAPNKYKDTERDFPSFTFYDKSGTKVGNGSFTRMSKTDLYLDWVGVKSKHRGKGYASAAMKGVIKYAQSEGVKKLTLEVPNNAPDARHIYEKLGFRSNGKDTPSEGAHDPFGGLQGMEMRVPQKRIKHNDASDDVWEEQFADEFAQILIENFGSSGGTMAQSDDVEAFLAHFGVLGMKWGKRKTPLPVSAEAKQKQGIKDKVKKTKVSSVTNAQLQTAIRRMQLEQDFKRLSVNEKSGVSRWISSMLLEAGKREVQAQVAKKLTVEALKKVATAGAA